jgi:hypothetical protein
MRRIKTVVGVVAVMAAMLVVFAAPAMAQDRNDDFFDNHDNRFFDNNDDFFDSDFDQDADSGDVDQSFVVTNTGDNSNQCANVQGVANTGNAQNQIGVTQVGDGFNNNNDFDRFNNDDDFDRDNFFSDFDGFNNNNDGNFEFDNVGSSIEVSPTNTMTCDQQVNQAATASG